MASIRPVSKQDLNQLKAVIDSNGLFPSELLDEMTHDFFFNERTTDIWLTKEINNIPVAVAYCSVN